MLPHLLQLTCQPQLQHQHHLLLLLRRVLQRCGLLLLVISGQRALQPCHQRCQQRLLMLLWYRRHPLLARLNLWPSRTILRVPLRLATAILVVALFKRTLLWFIHVSMENEQPSDSSDLSSKSWSFLSKRFHHETSVTTELCRTKRN
jgi:hypothetical protein